MARAQGAAAEDAKRLTPKEERRIRWIARVGTLVIRALAMTWRIRLRGVEQLDRLEASGEPFVWAFWHGEMLPLLWQHRARPVSILISSHKDGEIIAQIAYRLGYRTVRGSSSRGAGRALLGLIRVLEERHSVAVTPDGPRGPAREFAPGALIAAQRTGAAILPLAAHADRAWRLRSWDRFMIPKPFARVTIAYGAPAMVEATTAREASEEATRFQALVDEAGTRARA